MQVARLADKYFATWRPAASIASRSAADADEALARPLGAGELHMEEAAQAGPMVFQAYYRPSLAHPNAIALDMIRSATHRLHNMSGGWVSL